MDLSILIENFIDNKIDTTSITINDKLCDLIWNVDILNEEVRVALLKNAVEFIKFSDFEDFKLNDVILTGSLANYNYNKYSDLDVHIVLDTKQISNNENLVKDYLKMKKDLWESKYPITVKGFDVEMYYQDLNQKHYSSGVYSLYNNVWIKKPVKNIITVDIEKIKHKTNEFIHKINQLKNEISGENFIVKYNILKNKLKNYREVGLEKNGEYSLENLVFKLLRNLGYLSIMSNLKKDFFVKQLSLNQ